MAGFSSVITNSILGLSSFGTTNPLSTAQVAVTPAISTVGVTTGMLVNPIFSPPSQTLYGQNTSVSFNPPTGATLTGVYGLSIAPTAAPAATGYITTVYGVQISMSGSSSTITNAITLSVANASGAGSITNNYTAILGTDQNALVGVGTAQPAYMLDVDGPISANSFDATGMTAPNQLISLAEGTNQGGFGGGSVGTNKVVRANSVTCFNLGYAACFGGAFDGRYVYLSPGSANNGLVTRYDTTVLFQSASGFAKFDTMAVSAQSSNYAGAVFDGRYVYFPPNGFAVSSTILRYDTTLSFSVSSSYTIFEMTQVRSTFKGSLGAVFDGRYIYFVPYSSSSILGRYDSTLSFTTASSYTIFNMTQCNANMTGYSSGVFDGRYIYFSPFVLGAISSYLARYDTTQSFYTSASYTAFNLLQLNAQAMGQASCVFDGRYVYFVPYYWFGDAGTVTRYDTQQSFVTTSSYTTFDLTLLNTSCRGFYGGVFDGRYIYFVPDSNTAIGLMPSYDTTQPFLSITSYTIYDLRKANSNARGFIGAVFDGRYVYLANYYFNYFTRIDAYPGPQATAMAASQAPNGFVVGSYVGTSAPPTGGLIISGNVGVGTSNPQYTLDINGTLNATGGITGQIITPTNNVLTTNNQTINLAEGNNQGGIGGALIGTNKQMSANSTTCFDTTTINANSHTFRGGVFDGRYIYLVPYNNNTSGQITRYDTTLSFLLATSYTTFDTLGVNGKSKGFNGGVFDGRYVYLVPGGFGGSGQITQYDTTQSFTVATSYTTFDTAGVNGNSQGFEGGVFDGLYVYLVPFNNGSYFGQITRYDTTQSFLLATSYAFFDTAGVNGNSKGFIGGVFDGRYVYLVPRFNGVYFGQVTRYDTTLSFTAATSYTCFDTVGVNSNSKGFYSGVFDGRYVYLVPDNNGTSGQITRYDTTQSFLLAASYTTFDTAGVNGNSKGFFGGVFDGRYVYLVPSFNGSFFGQITRYDTTQSFRLATSYTTFDTAGVNGNSKGFLGGVFDGRYVYLVPNNAGLITRIDAYPGPLATSMAVSQAPNGFVIGSYAGINPAPLNGLIVSGNVGVGTSTPGYTLDINGTLHATGSILGPVTYINVVNALTTNNQTINLAEGYNQGGLGGGFVGTNKVMSANSTTTFNMSKVNTASKGFIGGVFDGRYIYLVPYQLDTSPTYSSLVTRYDTTSPINSAASYTTFALTTVDPGSFAYNGGVFDGRYVYFVPARITTTPTNGTITRYDTTLSFTAASSYATFNPAQSLSDANASGFRGGVFDGRYVYYVPNNPSTPSGEILRYDTTSSFGSAGSYAIFDSSSLGAGYAGGVYDGRYVYFVPSGFTFAIVSYDTTLSFNASGSYTSLDLRIVNSSVAGFFGAVFDGRYVYLLNTIVARYDTTASFNLSSSYTIFDTTPVNNIGFRGGVFDGRYIYLVPFVPTASNSTVTRYDTTLSFNAIGSYTTLSCSTGSYFGALYDGKYVYLVPSFFTSSASNSVLVRLDAYPGPLATAMAASQAPNGFVIGSYAGNTTPLSNNLVISGNVGVGTANPQYTLDINGTLNGTYSGTVTFAALNALTTNNQTINLAEGNSQGGFGGGLVGTNKTMSANSTTTFDMSKVNTASKGFVGGVFDGRYIYLVPFQLDTSPIYSSLVTRYDTTSPINLAASYTTFTMTAVDPGSFAYSGGVFDGRYVYFVPARITTTPINGTITRYDTTLSFTATSSYTVFNPAQSLSDAAASGFRGGVFDGRYVYYVPNNPSSPSGEILRYDTTSSFGLIGSYTIFDSSSLGAGYAGGVYDGRYVYFVPSGFSFAIVSYDTTLSFNASGSYASLDLRIVNSSVAGFFGAVFDGRYVYLLNTIVARYDTTASFTLSSSYTIFDTTPVNNIGFRGGVFDGRYIYLVPFVPTASPSIVTRYDTTLFFNAIGSYTTLGCSTGSYFGALYDGKYVYLVPSLFTSSASNSVLVRLDAYPGPLATAMAASSAPNGFAIGAYAGINTSPLNGLIVSGNVGVNTTTPQYTLDINGVLHSTGAITGLPPQTINALTTNNQTINLAEGYNQGGFGGGLSGTNKTMSANSTTCFDTQTINVKSAGFNGGVFDGRYVYLVPNFNTDFFGQITRYDTTLSFLLATSYTTFDTAGINANSKGFTSGVFDGRYVYLVPYNNGLSGQITRYDTTLSFTVASSYTTFDTAGINAKSIDFVGGVFDGRYVYLVPSNGQITRYDTTLSFLVATSYTTFDTTGVNAGSTGFIGGVFDGRYVYLVPGAHQITRYDTTLSFLLATSYTCFNTIVLGAQSQRFFGGVFDGRYVYLVPNNLGASGQIARYDTTLSFLVASSYTTFDTKNQLNGNSKGFYGGVFDGRYVYLVPFSNGQITRYDTTESFLLATSYTTFDTTAVNANSQGFIGGIFDGRYVYLVPNNNNSSGLITRIDAYPGPLATAMAASSAPNGFVIGSYAGINTPPLNGLIVSGNVGVGTSVPDFALDINDTLRATGTISGTVTFAVINAQTTNNQTINLAEGYNQGGFGGGLVGTNKTMSANSTTCFDTTIVNANSKGFQGAAFDGRYIYFVPNTTGSSYSGQITRFDTQLPFYAASSYMIFDTTQIDTNSCGFYGAAFDGRYVYFVPFQNNSGYSGQITRYDTMLQFTARPAYAVFDTAVISSNSKGFIGAVFDGRYIYFVPSVNGNGSSGQITRYDTTLSFLSAVSYTTFDMKTVNAASTGFFGGVFDGRYVYFAPNAFTDQITRYDTTLSFLSTASYTTMNMISLVNSNSKGFRGGVFDGRYLYLVPNSTSIVAASGLITRYDTTLSFVAPGSYTTFNMASLVNANSKGFSGGVFDGRYIYFVPFFTSIGVYSGLLTRYDTTLSFLSAGSYATLDTVAVLLNTHSVGFSGGVFDGRYVYLAPSSLNGGAFNGQVTRIDAYPGPLATAMAASFAPNGFAIGSYAGTAPPLNGLIVSGNVGVGTMSANSALTINGTLNATTFSGTVTAISTVNALTTNNQLINLATGYNQGGFGGGLVGTNKLVSANYATVFNIQAVSSLSKGFEGGVFDGRYLYFVPSNLSVLTGLVIRFDTQQAFAAAASYDTVNTTNMNSNSAGFREGVFDGRYIYFVPYQNSSGVDGYVARYDTTLIFVSSGSWAFFNIASVNANGIGFSGGVFDGRFVYFVPYYNGAAASSLVVQYDTYLSFAAASSYSTFDTSQIHSQSRGFNGGIFDGRYVYLIPGSAGGVNYSIATRYDTSLPYVSLGSWTVFDVAANVSTYAKGFFGAIYDGRFLYFVPNTNDSGYSGWVLRYDTTQSFLLAVNYALFNLASINGNYIGFCGGAFDGRYVYFAPFQNGQIVYYDTTESFLSSSSYTTFNMANVNSNSIGFTGAIFDGRYVYFIPFNNGASSYFARIDAYPGPQATAIAVNQAPNGLAMGSYAGVVAPDYQSILNGGNIGIGTMTPNAQVDVFGIANATSVSVTNYWMTNGTADNQLINLAEGYNQGGFNSGLVGTNKTMSAYSITCFDTTIVNSLSVGFSGAVFDGRYIYFVPYNAGTSGVVCRYDTTLVFNSSGSYATFDLSLVSTFSTGCAGGVFDGRYVYFVPNVNAAGRGGTVTRYDTTLPFVSVSSYSIFNTTTIHSLSQGFQGAVFDGRYVYFVPYNNGSYDGIITRYDTTLSFIAATSFTSFNTQTANANSLGFEGGVFDGRYIYFVPNQNGQITQYDTTLSFNAVASYTTFDTKQISASSYGFFGGVFDGRYVYFVPYFNSTYFGQITRYDTTLSFISSGSYTTFDTAQVSAASKGFQGAVFDGRYVYLVPYNNGSTFGQVTSYDTTQSFLSSSSYAVFDTALVNLNSKGFSGAVFDGRYVYMATFTTGQGLITRIEAYPGPQATAMVANQAPNGLAVGSYAGVVVPQANDMIVSGNVGVGTPTPQYSLDVSGTINASTVRLALTGLLGSTANNQLITLAEGYNQGGFGGGSAGTNKQMSANSITCFDLTAVSSRVNSGNNGAIFDGRYVYIMPCGVASGINYGTITRYDTTVPFSLVSSYTTFDLTQVHSHSIQFAGAIFDGRYIYFSPYQYSIMTRYDTTLSFTAVSSYSAFNTSTGGFWGAVYDGRYVYYVPNFFTQFVRYDPTLAFNSASSYVSFDIAQVASVTFHGAVFDGRYIYLVPFYGVPSGTITRYDTTLSLTTITSYTTFDTLQINSNCKGFVGGVFDGRFVYFMPYAGSNKVVARYDTTISFTTTSSYTTFDLTAQIGGIGAIIGGTFDGRYVYLAPFGNNVIPRYDTTGSFVSSSSFTIMNLGSVNSKSGGFWGAVFDGRYVYFIPNAVGFPLITRVDAYPGPQATAMAASQAPNGFAVGAYAGVSAPPLGGLIVSGNVGIGIATPTFSLHLGGSGVAFKTQTSTWTINSDVRIKRNIRDVTDALSTVRQLLPRSFTYHPDYARDLGVSPSCVYYGFVADEVEKVIEGCVRPSAINCYGGKKNQSPISDKMNLKILDLHHVFVHGIQAVKELADILNDLQQKIDNQK